MTQVLPDGHRVVVDEFADSPTQALEKYVRILPMTPPSATELKPHEILIAVKSASVAWVDLLMTSGQYQHMPSPPYTPGLEYSGAVVAVGSGVDAERCEVGDRVLVDFMMAGARSHGDYQHAGGFASYAVVPQDAVHRIPERLSFDQAANLLGPYETAYHCLITRAQLQRGERVLINGASGLTGLAAVQVAKLLGATVIATGRSDDKLELVSQHGADHVINAKGEEGGVRRFRDEVKALTNGEGVDVVYDTVGGDTSLECMRCTAFGARFLIVGWTSTPNVANGRGLRGSPNANQLPTNIIQMKGLSVLGSPAVIAAQRDPAMRRERLAQILQWAEEGAITPFVSHTFPLHAVKDAMLARWNGGITGGCVLNP